MTTDLETRLRRYGTTLDNATSTHPAPELRHAPNVAELELSHTASRPRRRTRSLIAAAGLVAAASVAFVTSLTLRDTPNPAPASMPAAVGNEWPVRMSPVLTPWFELNDAIVAMMDLQAPEPGPAQRSLRCTSWTVDDQTVVCSSLTGEGYLPAVTYPGAPGPDASYAGRYVDVSTLHSDIDAATYATNWSQGKDVGYEDTPLPQQDVRIGGAPARLIETSSGIRRVTWSPRPGVLVAVETGPGLTRDSLLAIADNIMPTRATPTIPLVLAATHVDAGEQAIALGGVVNGEICLATATGCTPMQTGTTSSSVLYTQPTENGIAGLATADVATIRVTWPDGAMVDITPTPQPIGTTQAFAFFADSSVILTALDAIGNTIPDTELTSDPDPPETVPSSTVLSTTPPTITVPADVLEQLDAGVSARYLLSTQGMHLFVATPDDTISCVIVDSGDGYPAGCADDTTIANSEFVFVYGANAESPTILAGIAPDDVTRVIVDGVDAAMAEHTWLAVSTATDITYTLVRSDGTTQTVQLGAAQFEPEHTVPGSTAPSTDA